jgi:hypothetical protein
MHRKSPIQRPCYTVSARSSNCMSYGAIHSRQKVTSAHGARYAGNRSLPADRPRTAAHSAPVPDCPIPDGQHTLAQKNRTPTRRALPASHAASCAQTCTYEQEVTVPQRRQREHAPSVRYRALGRESLHPCDQGLKLRSLHETLSFRLAPVPTNIPVILSLAHRRGLQPIMFHHERSFALAIRLSLQCRWNGTTRFRSV